jgi:excisionase family DNA binding protein
MFGDSLIGQVRCGLQWEARHLQGTSAYKRSQTAISYVRLPNTIVADPPPSEREFLKVEEVAALLKIKEKTVREWIGRGELQAYKIGKEWRVRRDHLDEAIEGRRVGAEPAPPGGLWDPAGPDER